LVFRIFEEAVIYCRFYQDTINLTFVLGFYVSVVFNRWQDQFRSIPWPDTVAIMTVTYLTGEDERSRLMRRTVMRYINLSYVMTMRSISPPVKKRFPTMDHMVDAGM
jgi:bestrophin, other